MTFARGGAIVSTSTVHLNQASRRTPSVPQSDPNADLIEDDPPEEVRTHEQRWVWSVANAAERAALAASATRRPARLGDPPAACPKEGAGKNGPALDGRRPALASERGRPKMRTGPATRRSVKSVPVPYPPASSFELPDDAARLRTRAFGDRQPA
jgi:hypothetical protein